MTDAEVRDWLPAEATMREPVRMSVAAVVAEWAKTWFVDGDLHLTGWALAPWRRQHAADDGAWREVGGGLEMRRSSRAAARVLGLALSAPSDLQFTDRDQSLTKAFEDLMTGDLTDRLLRLLGPQREGIALTAGRPAVIATVSAGADDVLALAIAPERLIALCRRTLLKPAPAAPLAETRRRAIARTEVRLAATLGGATISLADVHDLAVGDVLVLDRTVDQPVELRLAQTDMIAVCGGLTEAAGHLALTLHPSQESQR